MADNSTILEKLDGLVARFEEISTLITDPAVIADQKRYVKLTKEYKELDDLMKARKEYMQLLGNIEEARNILANESDADMREMAKEEMDSSQERLPVLEEEIKLMLVPADPQDSKNAILEIRGGTGGDEAAIFAGDLFRMYAKYCETKGWKMEVSSANEVVMSPMGTNSALANGRKTDNEIDYFIERAKGGVGMIIMGCQPLNEKIAQGSMEGYMDSFTVLPSLTSVCDGVHKYGAKIVCQLTPGTGRNAFPDTLGNPPMSASEIPSAFDPNLMCHALTKEEISKMMDDFKFAAGVAMDAGYDAIEIHAHAGYLIDQFLSPVWNKRTDEYGGSPENNTRFAKDIYHAIREVVGKDVPILFRISLDHRFNGGRDLEYSMKILKELEKEGYKIAMHGFNHVYDTKTRGNINCGFKSEFAGHSFIKQYEKIKKGKEILESHNVYTDVFFAPSHSYDDNTLRALSKCGFKYISDGYSKKIIRRYGIKCVPCRTTGVPKIKNKGNYTAVFHAHEWVRSDKAHAYNELENLLKKYSNSIKDFDIFVDQPQGNYAIQNIIEKVTVFYLRYIKSKLSYVKHNVLKL